jgi:peptidyl-prolyl cis-trans isomerase-like 3
MSLTMTTTLGPIKIELHCDLVAKACYNFLALAASGYYDRCEVHRVIEGFLMQSGDASNKGDGGTSVYGGKMFDDEIVESLRHDRRGVVAMANAGSPNTNLSQFYITFDKQAHLDGTATIIGRVVDGFDVLDALERVDVDQTTSRPTKAIVIEHIKIHANPLARED